MPDQGWTDKVLVAHEEYVVVRAVRESTWSAGSFRGFATPQGVTWQLRWCIFGVANGKIVEHWAVRDDLALMRQLGVVKVGLGR
jgi:predicted ester cyclase